MCAQVQKPSDDNVHYHSTSGRDGVRFATAQGEWRSGASSASTTWRMLVVLLARTAPCNFDIRTWIVQRVIEEGRTPTSLKGARDPNKKMRRRHVLRVLLPKRDT